MYYAKEYENFIIRTAQKRILKDNINLGIFTLNSIPKVTKKTIELCRARKETYKNEIAAKISEEASQDKKTVWLSKLYKSCSTLGIDYLIVPVVLKKHKTTNLLSLYALFSQKINSILLSDAYSNTKILIENKDGDLAGLSYIVQKISYLDKVMISINLDILLNDFYEIEDVKKDIIKYDLKDKILMISSKKYKDKDKEITSLLQSVDKKSIILNLEKSKNKKTI